MHGFGGKICLNKKENEILTELCLKMDYIVERAFLLEKYWQDSAFIYSRSLDTYIAKLRKYLQKEPSIQIITVKGVGYKLEKN